MLQVFGANVCFRAGQILARLRLHGPALSLFQRASDLMPEHLAARIFIAWSYQKLKRLDEAMAAFERALQIAPDYAYAHLELGNLLVAASRYLEGANSLNRAIRINPKYGRDADCLIALWSAYAHLGESEKALAILVNNEDVCRRDEHFSSYLGWTLLELERYGEAEQHLREAILSNPDEASAHHDLGCALWDLKKFAECAEEFRIATRLRPDNWMSHIGLGMALREDGNYHESISVLKNVLELNPDDADAYHQIAVTYGDAGRWNDALGAGKQLARLRPDDELSYLLLGAIYHELGNHEQSLGLGREALRINPESLTAMEEVARQCLELDRCDDAVAVLKKAISTKNDAPVTHSWLALAYAHLGEFQAASDEMCVLRNLDPVLAKETEGKMPNEFKSALDR